MSAAGESSSSVATHENADENVDGLILKIYTKIAHDGILTTVDHIKVADSLILLQSSLQKLTPASKSSQVRLICVISSILRRIVRMDEEVANLLYSTFESPETSATISRIRRDIDDLEHTSTLVFIVSVLIDVAALGADGLHTDSNMAFDAIKHQTEISLWENLSHVSSSKRKLELPDNLQLNERNRIMIEEVADRPYHDTEQSSSWSTNLSTPGNLSKSALRAAGTILSNQGGAFEEIERLGKIFASSANEQLMATLLFSPNDFQSLAREINADEKSDFLDSILSAGESESGQSVLRDLIISFLLPTEVVGKRRTLLLSRESAALCSKKTPWISSLAYEAAMQGCEYVYKKSNSDLKKTAALLAGLSVLTTKGTDDAIRKATAFSGLVQLPFLRTAAPQNNKKRIILIASTRKWAVYSLSKSGKPIIEMSQAGLAGLESAILSLRDVL